MPLSIPAVQRALTEEGLDGWLLYDFHGSNPIARRLTGLDGTAKMTTRRWFYVIPATGEPKKLVHAIEPYNLDHLPGGKTIYSQREKLSEGLRSKRYQASTRGLEGTAATLPGMRPCSLKPCQYDTQAR